MYKVLELTQSSPLHSTDELHVLNVQLFTQCRCYTVSVVRDKFLELLTIVRDEVALVKA